MPEARAPLNRFGRCVTFPEKRGAVKVLPVARCRNECGLIRCMVSIDYVELWTENASLAASDRGEFASRAK